MTVHRPDANIAVINVLLFLLGLALALWLLPGPPRLASLTFSVHTLLSAAMAIVMGFESVNFAGFIKTFASPSTTGWIRPYRTCG